jgi:hypothetical protein
MANGTKAQRRLQFARLADSDSGEAIAATTIWRGTGTLEDTRNVYFVPEDVGLLSGTDRSNTSMTGSALALDATEATYEQLPHILEMAIQTATPVSDSGGGDGWIYTYTFPTTAIPTVKPYSIEGGDNNQAESAAFFHCADFTLSGNEQEAWMMSANLFGRAVANDTFTAGLTLPAVNHMNFGKTLLYIDADSDAYGTTLKSNSLLQASLKYTTGLVPKFTADGRLDMSFVQSTMFDATLTLTFEHNTNAVTEKTNWRNETARIIRLINEGPAFTTGGVYDYRTVIIDVPGKWLDFAKIGERNGNDVLEGTFQIRYNATKASAGSIVVVNSLASLP